MEFRSIDYLPRLRYQLKKSLARKGRLAGMLGISFSEFIIIIIAGFLIVGPKRFVESANAIGLWIGKIKKEITHFKQTGMGGIDASTMYEPETDLNKSLEDINKST